MGWGMRPAAPEGCDHRFGPPGPARNEHGAKSKEEMGLMDKVKASAEVGLAKAGEAASGQAKLDAAQARHRADGCCTTSEPPSTPTAGRGGQTPGRHQAR